MQNVGPFDTIIAMGNNLGLIGPDGSSSQFLRVLAQVERDGAAYCAALELRVRTDTNWLESGIVPTDHVQGVQGFVVIHVADCAQWAPRSSRQILELAST